MRAVALRSTLEFWSFGRALTRACSNALGQNLPLRWAALQAADDALTPTSLEVNTSSTLTGGSRFSFAQSPARWSLPRGFLSCMRQLLDGCAQPSNGSPQIGTQPKMRSNPQYKIVRARHETEWGDEAPGGDLVCNENTRRQPDPKSAGGSLILQVEMFIVFMRLDMASGSLDCCPPILPSARPGC